VEAGGKSGEAFDEAGVGERLYIEARGLRRRGDQRLRREPGVSRPKEFHLRPLAERCVNLSIHTAPIR